MREAPCIVCGRLFTTRVARKKLCDDPDCHRARRRAREAGSDQPGLPPPTLPCEVCGKPVQQGHGRRPTCASPGCRRVRQRERWRAYYHALPPEKKQAAQARQAQARRERPEVYRAQDARRWQRLKANPERLARARARAREHYARHAEEIQARRRERLASMSLEELALRLARMREYVRKHRDAERADPSRYARRRQYQQEYRRRQREEQMAVEALQVATVLGGRMDAPARPKPCTVCGQPVVARHPTAVTCGREECLRQYRRRIAVRHREKSSRAEVVPCPRCGTPFRADGRRRYCSAQCREAQQADSALMGRPPREVKPPREPLMPRDCVICHRTYQPGRNTQKTCAGSQCKAEHKRRLEARRQEKIRANPQETKDEQEDR